jgi:hypothetical protein
VSLARKLDARRERLSPLDRALLDYHLAAIRGDMEAEYVAGQQMSQLAPRSEWLYKLAVSALETNRPAAARDALLRIDPRSGWMRHWPAYWEHLTEASHRLGDHERELADARRAVAQFPTETVWTLVRPLAAMGRLTELDSVLDAVRVRATGSNWPEEGGVFNNAVRELHVHGRQDAVAHVVAVFDSLRATWPDSVRLGCGERIGRNGFLTYAGRHADAFDSLHRLERECGDNDALHSLIALDAAFLGRRASADSALAVLARRHAADSDAFSRTYLRYTTARVAAILGDRKKAVDLLRGVLTTGDTWYFEAERDMVLPQLHGYPPYDALVKPRG